MITEWANSLAEGFGNAISQGSLLVFPMAFAAGILASLTPCVYPLIPVTVAYIGGRAEGSRARAFTLSLLYSLGIALTYAIIGIILAAVRNAGGSASYGDIAKSPWIALGIGVLCVLFAMVMFDKLAVHVPGFLQRAQSKQRGGYLGALVAGLIFGSIASPCLSPVVGLLAVLGAVRGNLAYSGALLLAFGLGLGVLFVIVGTFTGMVTSLPRAGSWMERIKNGFAWAMLAVAAGFIFHGGVLYERALARAALAETPIVQGARKGTPQGITLGAGTPESPATSQQLYPLVSVEPGLKEKTPQEGDAAPDFTWRAPDGERRLSDHRGQKAVWLVFFADWCHNCPEEVPPLNKLQATFPEDLFVLGIDVEDEKSVALRWMEKYGMRYPAVWDRDGEICWEQHDLPGIPWNVLIDKQGVIRYAGAGIPKDAEDRVRAAIAG